MYVCIYSICVFFSVYNFLLYSLYVFQVLVCSCVRYVCMYIHMYVYMLVDK